MEPAIWTPSLSTEHCITRRHTARGIPELPPCCLTRADLSAGCACRNYLHCLQEHTQMPWSRPNAGSPSASCINCNPSQIFLDYPSFIWSWATKLRWKLSSHTLLQRQGKAMRVSTDLIPCSPAEGAGIHEAVRWSPRVWWGPWLDDTSSRHLSIPFSDPEGLEPPCPHKKLYFLPTFTEQNSRGTSNGAMPRYLERHRSCVDRRLELVQLQLRAILWVCWKPNSHASIWVCRWGYF